MMMVMIDYQSVERMTGKDKRSSRRKPAPVPHCLQHIPHNLNWDRSGATTVESRLLTAYATSRSWLWVTKSPKTGMTLLSKSSSNLPNTLMFLGKYYYYYCRFCYFYYNYWCYYPVWPPLWTNGQSSRLPIQKSRVKFPMIPDFLTRSGSETGSTRPREDNWEATWKKSSGSALGNRD
jgi:hypothetical protein